MARLRFPSPEHDQWGYNCYWAMPFAKSARITIENRSRVPIDAFYIEHGGTNDEPNVDYASVAYWYQTHPKPPFPALPRELMPVEPQPIPRIAGIIEAELLQPTARATEGTISIQDMSVWIGDWSNLSQLWWLPTRVGSRLTLSLSAPEAKQYELIGYFTRARDYGNARLTVNGQALQPVLNGYAAEVSPSVPISFGRVSLKAGVNEIQIKVIGKEEKSEAYLVGIDGFVLKLWVGIEKCSRPAMITTFWLRMKIFCKDTSVEAGM